MGGVQAGVEGTLPVLHDFLKLHPLRESPDPADTAFHAPEQQGGFLIIPENEGQIQ